MIRAAIIAALMAAPAAADVSGYMGGGRMILEPGSGDCFAVVSIRNTAGVYNRSETLDTEHGPVIISYETVGGHNPEDHDLIDVQSTPANVLAVPMHIDLPDGDTGEICLMYWVGS